jgi:hypothetical protein
VRFEKKSSTLKNAIAYYHAGVVNENYKVSGLAPDAFFNFFCFTTLLLYYNASVITGANLGLQRPRCKPVKDKMGNKRLLATTLKNMTLLYPETTLFSCKIYLS